jgi:FtsH-binding integral membrane protein
MTSSMRSTTLRLPVAVAPVLDALCLMVFVVAGRQSHDLQGGASWFFVVVWPLLVGWFVTALATRLYTRPDRVWLRLAATVVVGVAIALLLRATVTHRDTPVAFVLVAYLFITALTAGWRLVVLGIAAARRRRDSAPGAPAGP